ncbi:hypothetical protein HUU05_26480 [candidate division KSB1 bacterium]|nr:hypothetical protein [candidate division KSB1 bacterium]
MNSQDHKTSTGRVVMSRVVRRDQHDRSFDLEFWQKLGAEKRFAAAWQMVKEVQLMRGQDGHQPRLQRSISVLKRRES